LQVRNRRLGLPSSRLQQGGTAPGHVVVTSAQPPLLLLVVLLLMMMMCCCCCVGQTVAAAAAQAPPWIRSPQGRDRLASTRSKVKALVSSGQINQSQAKAIDAALTRTCTLWQGPPGTGEVHRAAVRTGSGGFDK
jgi:hypothetical protein